MTALSVDRLRYYQQQYLGVADFETEQEYHRTMRRRHQLGPHTWGIVAGLRLDERVVAGTLEIHLLPGYAIDGFGREIVLGEPVRIDPDPVLFKGVHEAGYVPLWITYDERDTRPPTGGYAGCEGGTETTRITEGWRLLAGAPGELHPEVIVAGLPDQSPADGSVPHQEFPEGTPRWLIRVGAVNWDGQGFVASDPVRRDELRLYAGLVGAALLAPAGVVRIGPRFPVPDPAAGRPADVAVVDGPLRVTRHGSVGEDLLVGGRIGAGTDQPVDRLQLGTGLGRVVGGRSYLGFNASRGSGADPPWTFAGDGAANGGAALIAATDGGLRMVTKASGGGADDTVADSQLRTRTRLAITAAGQVGIGTPDPDPARPLTVRAVGTNREILAVQDTGSGSTAWHVNLIGNGLNIAETGVADGRLYLRAGGNAGIGTAEPTNPLHVPAATGIRQGNQYLSGGASWSSLSFNAHHNATNNDWVFPDQDRLAATVEMDAPAGRLGGRFEVWGTTRAAPRTFTNRLHINLDSGDTLLVPQGGRVGVGTGSPASPLHVASVLGIQQGAQYLTGGGSVGSLSFNAHRNATNDDWIFPDPARLAVTLEMGGEPGNQPGRFEVYGTTEAHPDEFTRRFAINTQTGTTLLGPTGGNVGIGITQPGVKVDVAGDMRLTGTIGTNGMHPRTGLPNGWGGGLHAWDVYAEGTIATGTAGGTRVTIGGNGIISADEINAPTKNFRIPHPSRADTDLVHTCLEGPEAAVCYRGTAILSPDGVTEVCLPSYFEALTQPDGRTVHLTPALADALAPPAAGTALGAALAPTPATAPPTSGSGLGPVVMAAGPVQGGRFVVRGGAGQEFHWLVMAVRADVPPLEVEQPRGEER
jgi:hypothetical protein